MKKLMIAAAIVCAAAFANAATCSWATQWVWTEGIQSTYDNGGVGNYYLIALGANDVGGYAISTDGKLVYDNGTGYTEVTGGFTKGDIAFGAASGTIDGLAAANNGDKYALLFLDTVNSKWGISDAAAIAGITDVPPANANPIYFSNYIDTAWDSNPEVVASNDLVSIAPVPEPTSGLLLLLGVAGLALRRRRA